MRDEPTPYEHRYIPESVRLQIPLRSVVNLRRVAEELRGLAFQLDTLSRYPEETPALTAMTATTIIRRAQERIASIRYRGRPRLQHLRDEHTRSSGRGRK